jgi:hypothetical protein
MKRYSLVIQLRKIEISVRYHHTPLRMAKIIKTNRTVCRTSESHIDEKVKNTKTTLGGIVNSFV